MNKGYVILAQNTKTTNYVKCAEALALSIYNVMPNAKVSLITNENCVNFALFDSVIPLPYGDLEPNSDWKLINDWQIYEASPYEYTIKLEADLYITKDINYWFDILEHRDLVICTTIRNFKQEISKVRGYRRFIDDNYLPDVYNAITYFKKSDLASKFFSIVKNIFENWSEYRKYYKCKPDEPVTTDWAYAIAAYLLGIEKTTMPVFTDMSMIHMKEFINGNATENWTDTFVYEIFKNQIKIQTVPQLYPLHYHVKSFANKLLEVHNDR